jgi:hypothetical protein
MFLGFDIEKQNTFHLSWQFNWEYNTKQLRCFRASKSSMLFFMLGCLSKQKWKLHDISIKS